MAHGAPGELTVSPNPATEGGTISVSYQGEHTLYTSIDGGPWTPIPLDDSGSGSVQVPQGANFVAFSDRAPTSAAEAIVEVLSTGV